MLSVIVAVLGQLTAREVAGMIRFVTFDALQTLITPRKPIHVQYSEVFRPYLGTLPPDAISRSFKLGVLFYLFHIVTAKPKQWNGSTATATGGKAILSCGC